MRWLVSGLAMPLVLAGTMQAQLVRLNATRPKPQGVVAGSVSLSATPATVSFALAARGAVVGSAPVTITASFSGLTLLSSMALYGFFSTSVALTDTRGDQLPSAAVFGRCATGSPVTFTSFTQSGPYASGSSLLIWQSSSILALGAGRSDVLTMKIDLTSYPQLPAGVYSGTLNLQVQAL